MLWINSLNAQTKSAKDLYWDFVNYRMDSDKKSEALEQSLKLLEYKAELNEGQAANLNYHIGRLYEETGSPEKSIPYYEQTIALSPGYYVPYRALAFINVKKCNQLGNKMNLAAKDQNMALYTQIFKEYKTQVLKTVPYLEKAQACDGDEQTLAMIGQLYKSIRSPETLMTLPERIKKIIRKLCYTFR